MKIFVRFGHSHRFTGSSGYLDEVTVIREYAPWVAQTLYYAGHQVMTYDPDTDSKVCATSGEELNEGVNRAKAWGADLFVSCHVNANMTASYTTVLTRANDTLANSIGENLCTKLCSALGTDNNHCSHPTDKGELNNTTMPALIIEPFFVGNQTSCNKYTSMGAQQFGTLIGNAILEKI